jgi:hypothetical protein
MERNEIIDKYEVLKMARQAGAYRRDIGGSIEFLEVFMLERFAKLVADVAIAKAVEREREACAKICETEWDGDSDTFEHAVACNECAEAIRARGEA